MNFILLFLLIFPVIAHADDKCFTLHFADTGWTDVSVTTAVAKEITTMLGYEAKISLFSLPVLLAGLENGDVDIFLGNWMPTQEADSKPYLERGSLARISENLRDAHYSLAVPEYVYQAGIRSMADLAAYAEQFSHRIYALEPGNDGNRLIANMISKNAFNLADWQLVESSEQGMLNEVKEAIKEGAWIVFLGWSPHPMNLSFKMRFLSGAENYFGPDFGRSSVFTLMNKKFSEQCPNITKLFRQLIFSLSMENSLMREVLENNISPDEAAQTWIQNNPETVSHWLKGIHDVHGVPARLSLNKAQDTKSTSFSLPFGVWLEDGINFLIHNFSHQFRDIARGAEKIITLSTQALLQIHWIIIVSFLSIITWLIHRSLKLFFMVIIGFSIIANISLWQETMQTLILIFMSVMISILIGVPLGVLSAHNKIIYKIMRPLLDLMQTLPTFVYLIPTLVLFGLGVVPGLVATVLFSIAAPIRFTYFGITEIPRELKEAAEAFGATPWQRLIKVEFPGALSSIMMGISQCIMLSLSMVVIAALVGAEGLGEPVVRALNTVDIKLGCEAGMAIVLLAFMLERCCTIKPKSFCHEQK